ncbi:MAG: hypothetical protein ACOCQD_04600 [archaeon]
MVKLAKILWGDFIEMGFASFLAEGLRISIFTVLLGAIIFLVLIPFGVADLTILEWSFFFLVSGVSIEAGVIEIIMALYVLTFIFSSVHKAFTDLPDYIQSVKGRLHK